MNKFSDAPREIREYLGSSRISANIDEINKNADIATVGTIAELLFELITKKIPTNSTVSRIKEKVGINSDEKAKAIAREIKEKILQPIYYSLLNWGIDINDIDTEGAPTLEELAKKETEFLESLGIKTETPRAPVETREEIIHPKAEEEDVLEKEQSIKISISELGQPETQVASEGGAQETGPLILQRETSPVETTRSQAPSKGFTLPFGFFKKPISGTRTTEPAKARIEFLKESMQTERTEPQKAEEAQAEQGGGFFGAIGKIKKDISGEQKKVVHYSELRTPITPFAKEEEFIDLESFGATPKETNNDDDNAATRTTRISPERREQSEDVTISAIGGEQEKPKMDAAQIKMKRESDDDDKRAIQTAQISPEQREESAKEEKKSPWKFSFIPKLWKKADTNDDNTAIRTTQTSREESTSTAAASLDSKPEKPKIDAVQIKTPAKHNDDDNTAIRTTQTSREKSTNWEEGPKVEGNVVDLR